MKSLKPGKVGIPRKDMPNPVIESLEKIHARYNALFDAVLKVMDEFKCGPIEIWRVANELQTVAFEQAIGNLGTLIEAKLGVLDELNVKEQEEKKT